MITVGVDIESINRFRKIINNDNFLNKIFTPKEIDYCFSKKNIERHLAVRFAGKEATIKAFCSMYDKLLDFKNIEITNNSLGVPKVKVHTDESIDISISLSHSMDNAIAYVHMEKL